MDNNVPNLDGMMVEEVKRWWRANVPMTEAKAAAIFPTRPTGYLEAAKALMTYAARKASAMEHRKDGNISKALRLEGECDKIYNNLPAYAKW